MTEAAQFSDEQLARLKSAIPYILTALVFLLGIYALYHLLAPLSLKGLTEQIRSVPLHALIIALLGTIIGYSALISYDASALRYLDKSVPRQSILLGGFLGYSIGNTVGLSAISGGAIRYRIYSAYGLDAYHVASISAFSAISYGLGASIIGLLALAFHPEGMASITSASPSMLRLIAIGSLVTIGAGLIYLGTRKTSLKIFKWDFQPPNLTVILTQLGITLVEVVVSGFVLYTLLPTSGLSFYAFLVAFTIATMAGIVSHVPGGVGVFETVIIAALPSTVAIDQAAAGVILFRLIYYILPFFLSLILLAIFEVMWRVDKDRMASSALAPIMRAGRGFAPNAIAFLVFASGFFLMISGTLGDPRDVAEDIEFFLPLALLIGPPFVTSVAGAILMVLAIGIWHRLWIAYWLMNAALFVGAMLALIYGKDIDRGLYMLFLLLVYMPFRHEFFRRSRLPQLFESKFQLIVMLFAVFALGTSIYFLILEPKDMAQVWWRTGFENGQFDPRGAMLTLSVIFLLGFLYFALQPRHGITEVADQEALGRASLIIDQWGQASDKLGLTGDKSLMFADNDRAVIAFAKYARSWVALGAPIGAKEAKQELMWDFVDAARREGARAVFYEADAEFMPLAVELGYNLFKMGEEAVIDLTDFSLDGPDRKKLRATYNRALRDGLSLEVLEPPQSKSVLSELRMISDAWLKDQKGDEKGFSVGQFSDDYIKSTPIARITLDGKTVAFANLLIAEHDKSVAIDLMRYVDEAPSSTMEFLFTALMLHYHEKGYRRFSLGMAPLSGFENRKGASLWTRFGALVFERGNRFYSFEGLRRFKSKFDPDWEPRYLVSKSVGVPVIPLKDATALISRKAII